MSVPTLTRRKNQLELLASACAARSRLRLTWREGPPEDPAESHFVGLEPDGVLLAWPSAGLGRIPVSGAAVAVIFEHRGRALAFASDTRGRVWSIDPDGAQRAALKLAVPLCFTRTFPAGGPLEVLGTVLPLEGTCLPVDPPGAWFPIRVTGATARGLRGSAPAATPPRSGDLCRLRLASGGAGRSEFIVRVAWVWAAAAGKPCVLEWMLCGTDDPRLLEQQVSRMGGHGTDASDPQTVTAGCNACN